jgi:hypothetical protein
VVDVELCSEMAMGFDKEVVGEHWIVRIIGHGVFLGYSY